MEENIIEEDVNDFWERRRKVREQNAMDNQSPLDSGENQSY